MEGGDEDWWRHMEKGRSSSLEDPRRVWGIHGVSSGRQSEEGISIWLHPKQRLEGTICIGHSRESSGHIPVHEIPPSLNKRGKVAS